MTAPTQKIRNAMYARDSSRCADCGTTNNLTFQHREASGNGGRGKKAPPLTTADGLTLCRVHNDACEAAGQARALRFGWKIRRNRGGILASQIPFYVRWANEWRLPDDDGDFAPLLEVEALELIAVAGGIT